MPELGGLVVLIRLETGASGIASHEAIATTKAGPEGLARSAAIIYAGAEHWVQRGQSLAGGNKLFKANLGIPAVANALAYLHVLGRLNDAA